LVGAQRSIEFSVVDPIRRYMARILIAEDDIGLREWLAEIILGAGHQVVTAADGLQAKSLAKRQIFDVMLTDISMPEEEGLGLIHAIRKERPDIKIIAISGKDPETLADAKLLGANAALRKPVSAKVILQWVSELSPEKRG